MTRLIVQPAARLMGEAAVPGDKSITHRAILLGGLAEGTTVVRRYLPADDCLRSLTAVEALGASVQRETGLLRIDSKGADSLREPNDVLDLGNSGTSLRLLTGLLAARPFLSILTGDASLRRRPMRRLIEPLTKMGAEIYAWGGGERAPVVVRGRFPLRAAATTLPVASAQLKSALLLAGLSADGDSTITEPARSRDHTERMLPQFGAHLMIEGARVHLTGPQRLRAAEIEVPADLSSGAFPLVAATIVPSADVKVPAVGMNPTRTGLLDALAAMGAKIEASARREPSGEPVADLTARPSALRGISVGGAQVVAMIDEFPIFCVAAAVAKGETVIRDAQELRVKESDRIAVMAAELKKFGVAIEELPDGLRIAGGAPLRGAVGHSHGDHRVAMALAVAGLVAEGETVVEDVDCIETSFPGFADLFRRLGAKITVESN